MSKILVLGDSTSSALGGESSNWLKSIANKPIWNENVEFIDTCAPGATAGSAFVVLLSKMLKERRSFSAAILSVGNCDRIRRPYTVNQIRIRKLLKLLILKVLDKEHRNRHSWPKLDLQNWIEIEPPTVHQTIENFTHALKLIKVICKLFRLPLIVIRVESNLYFPPATSANNSLYYSTVNQKYFNSRKISAVIPDLEDYESLSNNSSLNDVGFAQEIETLSSFSSSKLLCSVNNLAVNLAWKGDLDYALELLRSLLNEQNVKREFIYYNLGCIYSLKDDEVNARYFFELARDYDEESYRVNTLFGNKIVDIFENKKRTILIDLTSKNFNQEFLDHCHLLPAGQDKLANQIFQALRIYVATGECQASLSIEPANPEILEGDMRSFSSIFGLVAPKADVSLNLPKSRAHALDQILPFCGGYTIKTKFIEILESSFFIAITNNQLVTSNNIIAEVILKERARVQELFGQINIQLPEYPLSSLPVDIQLRWLENILDYFKSEVQIFLNSKVDSALRMRSIMSWYFRESLYFGFNSSYEMLFDRGQIRAWKEALAIAYNLDSLNGEFFNNQITNFFLFVLDLESELSQLYLGFHFRSHLPAILTDKEEGLVNVFLRKWSVINE